MAAEIISCPACGQRNRVPAQAAGKPACGKCKAPLPWVADAGDHDFTEIAEKSPIPVLVDMWATWCGPCRAVSPALEQVARELAGRVKLVKVDVDKAPALAQRYQIQAVPTLMIVRDGEVVARQAGAVPPAQLRRWVENTIGRP